jgi:hypothetical protein
MARVARPRRWPQRWPSQRRPALWLEVDLPPPPKLPMVAIIPMRRPPETMRAIIRFPDGTIFDERLPTPERLRKGKVKSAELGRLIAYLDLCLLKIGDKRVLPGGYGKWHKRAIIRWSEKYRRKGPGPGTPSETHKKSVPWINYEIDEAEKILAKHPDWRDPSKRKVSHVAGLVAAKVTGGKVTTIRRHIRHLFR